MMRGLVIAVVILLVAFGPCHADAHGSLEATSSPTLTPDVIEK